MVSYYRPVVTLLLACTVTEVLRDITANSELQLRAWFINAAIAVNQGCELQCTSMCKCQQRVKNN